MSHKLNQCSALFNMSTPLTIRLEDECLPHSLPPSLTTSLTASLTASLPALLIASLIASLIPSLTASFTSWAFRDVLGTLALAPMLQRQATWPCSDGAGNRWVGREVDGGREVGWRMGHSSVGWMDVYVAEMGWGLRGGRAEWRLGNTLNTEAGWIWRGGVCVGGGV